MASVVLAPIWILIARQRHQSVLSVILFLIFFDIVSVIFPFHWGEENWSDEPPK